MSAQDESKLFGIGFLAGAAIGLTLGLLYAPKPGSEMRAEIKDKAVTAEHKAEQIIAEAKEKAGHIIEEAKAKAASLKKDKSE